MRFTFLSVLFCWLIILSCASSDEFEKTQVVPRQTYDSFKDSITKQIPNLNLAERKQLLFNLVYNELPYYWQGTLWDFNGTTRTPKEGKIACGYFVTNTLSDLGFKINRVQLAQVASSKMIKELCVDTEWISGFDAFKLHLHRQDESGIYIVGLDFHTGYIIKSGTNSYFFHSNYINASGVQIESIESSAALKASKVFFIGNLTANETLLKNWGK